jgi:hypothetical protein
LTTLTSYRTATNPNKRMKIMLDCHNNNFNNRKPKILLENVDDKYIRDVTGFPSLSAFICYVLLINKGEVDNVMSNNKSRLLTWFEEWLMVSERIWGRSITRWSDAAHKYGLSERQLVEIFDERIKQVLEMKSKWGHYVTFSEDRALRKPFWEEDFRYIRLVMWDNTNVLLCFKPTCAEAQRNIYSCYYNGNVGKGGIHIQPCGWIGTHDLWMGAVSDTEYMLKGNVFERQDQFLKLRDSASYHVTWLNIFDKGYRNLGNKAMVKGRQKIVQPAFSAADRRFSSYDVLRSAACAAVRAGNERAVHIVKQSKFISSGLGANESCERLCNVWLCFGFQSNFRHRPTH